MLAALLANLAAPAPTAARTGAPVWWPREWFEEDEEELERLEREAERIEERVADVARPVPTRKQKRTLAQLYARLAVVNAELAALRERRATPHAVQPKPRLRIVPTSIVEDDRDTEEAFIYLLSED